MADIIKFVPKSWGYEKWIANSKLYCMKHLHVVRKRKSSVHFHKLKDETFYVNSGIVLLDYLPPKLWKYDEAKSLSDYVSEWQKPQMKFLTEERANLDCRGQVVLPAGSVFHIPPFTIHRFQAVQDADIFEVSTQHFDEDSYRIIRSEDETP